MATSFETVRDLISQ